MEDISLLYIRFASFSGERFFLMIAASRRAASPRSSRQDSFVDAAHVSPWHTARHGQAAHYFVFDIAITISFGSLRRFPPPRFVIYEMPSVMLIAHRRCFGTAHFIYVRRYRGEDTP